MKDKSKMILFVLFFACILSACSSIRLDFNTADLKVGETLQISPETNDLPITYESSDNSIATIDEKGLITAVDAGSATITAKNSKGKTDECQVTVSHVLPNRIKIATNQFTIIPEQSINISTEVRFIPQNVTERTLTYSVDSPNIVTVDEKGTITGITAGTATITATSSNGISTSCTIIVLPYAETISIDPTLELAEQRSKNLTATLLPKNCAKEGIRWTSSDDHVAKVVNGKVTAVGIGTAIITAETTQTHLTAYCTVTVTPLPLTITGLSMSRSSSIVGSTYQITYDISANVAGGSSNGYSYKFEIIQNGSVSKTTGWTTNNGISGTLSGNGTCELRITVKDSSGATATNTYNMLK